MSQGPMAAQPSMQANIGMFSPEPEELRNLMVNYIPITLDENQLRQIFEQAGQIETVKIVLDRNTNQSRGYGFVKYYTAACAQNAINRFNGFDVMGKRLKVAYAAAGKQKMNHYHHNNNNMNGMHGNMQGYYQPGYSNNFSGFQPGVSQGYPAQGADVVATMPPHYVVPSTSQQQAPRQ